MRFIIAMVSKQIIADRIEWLNRHRPDKNASLELLELLIADLSPQQTSAYKLLCDRETLTSMTIAAEMGLKQNHTDNILKQLENYGLIQKLPVSNDQGLHYNRWYVRRRLAR